MRYEIAYTRADMLCRIETIVSRKCKTETIIKEYAGMSNDAIWWKISAVSPMRDDENDI
jgi:hypothetical protein